VQHVLEAVTPGRAADDPSAGAQRALREDVPASRVVGKLETLAETDQVHDMIACRVTPAQGVKTNLARPPRPRLSLTAVDVSRVACSRALDHLGEPKGRTAWRVFFAVMMGLHDFYVPIG
jgi:hypothetical protein